MDNIIGLSPQALRKAANIQEKIQKLQTQLTQLLGATSESAPPAVPKKRRKRGRKKMSAATKKKMAALMKARWVKAKKAGKSKL